MMNNNLIPETVKYMITSGKTINTDTTLGFCVPGNPPSITLQEGQRMGVNKANGKPYMYKNDELKEAENILQSAFARYMPAEPWSEPVKMTVVFVFDETQKTGAPRNPGDVRTEKPDADNLAKMVIDRLCAEIPYVYINHRRIYCDKRPLLINDSQVVALDVRKVWDSQHAGLYIVAEKVAASVAKELAG